MDADYYSVRANRKGYAAPASCRLAWCSPYWSTITPASIPAIPTFVLLIQCPSGLDQIAVFSDSIDSAACIHYHTLALAGTRWHSLALAGTRFVYLIIPLGEVMMGTDRWLTLDELAGYLKLSRSKLYRMAQDREVPASKVASQWRFDRHEIDDWMKNQRPGADDNGESDGKGGER